MKESRLTKEDKFIIAVIYGTVIFCYFSALGIAALISKLVEGI